MNTTPEQRAALAAAGVPAALVGLVEFVEPDGSPVAVCDPVECSNCIVTRDDHDWRRWRAQKGLFVTRDGAERSSVMRLYQEAIRCPRCGTLVGVLPDETAYRIRFPRIVEEFTKVRDLLRDMETTDVTIAIQEREEARDQTRGLLAALQQAQAERDHLRRALIRVPTRHLPACPIQALADTKPVEGDFCREYQYRPEKLEHTSADCWLVWQEAVRAALAATEEAHDE